VDPLETQLRARAREALRESLEELRREAVDAELPRGQGSPTAAGLKLVQASPNHFQVLANRVWEWLNDGTGIYNPEHAGQGPGGRIVPVFARALHFKNKVLAQALGFKDENVFLKSVRGIQPRFIWDRHFREERILEKFARKL